MTTLHVLSDTMFLMAVMLLSTSLNLYYCT
jgi:hypothetical protein